MTDTHPANRSKELKARRSLQSRSIFFSVATIICILVPNLALAQAKSSNGPMEDEYSQTIRAEYAKCRDLNNSLSRFLCSCRVAAMQCDSPRRLEHGDWSTIEYWPSTEESEREVQFILLMKYDLLGDFDSRKRGSYLPAEKERQSWKFIWART